MIHTIGEICLICKFISDNLALSIGDAYHSEIDLICKIISENLAVSIGDAYHW